MTRSPQLQRNETILLLVGVVGLVGSATLIARGSRQWYGWVAAVNFVGFIVVALLLRRSRRSTGPL